MVSAIAFASIAILIQSAAPQLLLPSAIVAPQIQNFAAQTFGEAIGLLTGVQDLLNVVSGVTAGACHGPPVTGPCGRRRVRYYYDPSERSCKQFIYGGCQSNGNNWVRKSNCQRVCGHQRPLRRPHYHHHHHHQHGGTFPVGKPRSEKCYGLPVTGPCRGEIHRYFYDHASNECKPFTYGGCGGNANRWVAKECCQNQCIRRHIDGRPCCSRCQGPPDTGPGRALIPRYYYDASVNECKPFIYGGVGGNGNRWARRECCEKRCVQRQQTTCNKPCGPCSKKCKGPPDTGPGRAFIPRYYYDASVNECKPFTYGGVGGNENRWERRECCENQCLRRPREHRERPCTKPCSAQRHHGSQVIVLSDKK